MKDDLTPHAFALGTTWFEAPGFCGVCDLAAGVMAFAETVVVHEGRRFRVAALRGRAYHLSHLPWFCATGPDDVTVERPVPQHGLGDALRSIAAVMLGWSRGGAR